MYSIAVSQRLTFPAYLVAAFLDQTGITTLAAIIGKPATGPCRSCSLCQKMPASGLQKNSASDQHAHPASRSIRGTSRQPMTST
ncbi:MAG: hypothetical protein LC131_08660, partial [Anaerolineae bacterium]|nr:hypothetical protein [Anaerolineae bacterium]